MNNKPIAELFETVLQHAKCIEIRIDYAKALTSKQDKYLLTQALTKIRSAIDTICSVLPNSESVLKIKKNLDQADMVYVMVLTEQLMRIRPTDMEEVIELIDEFLMNKYGQIEKEVQEP